MFELPKYVYGFVCIHVNVVFFIFVDSHIRYIFLFYVIHLLL